MDDLISRAAAIECAIDAVDDWDGGWNPNRETVIRKYFEELPAIDAAPVVRCKDCKHWEVDWKPNYAQDGVHFCPMVSLVRRGDWFCADGERRDDDA